ncbi:hypothetical protein BJ508DRAFT_164790 [Ascobolus immersus RN42]|uniref:Uncharacterized protein n=1 Tax=Ascobolus immersus RN42 TaxID=1160509 RepID=A0A3N4HVI6_ASCIM|nr:hypothetical protein BJ508DRAFT_164790 [Ascobolus immersus RN42]
MSTTSSTDSNTDDDFPKAEENCRENIFCPLVRRGFQNVICGWSKVNDLDGSEADEPVGKCGWNYCITAKHLNAARRNAVVDEFFSIRRKYDLYLIQKTDINNSNCDFLKSLLRFPASSKGFDMTDQSTGQTAIIDFTVRTLAEFLCTQEYPKKLDGHPMIDMQYHCRMYLLGYRIAYNELMGAASSAVTEIIEILKTKEMIGEGRPICIGTFWGTFEEVVLIVYEGIKDSGPARIHPLKQAIAGFFGYIRQKRKNLTEEYDKSQYERFTQKYPKLIRDTLAVMEGMKEG